MTPGSFDPGVNACLSYSVCTPEEDCAIWGYNCGLLELPTSAPATDPGVVAEPVPGVGLGVIYQSEIYASISNDVTLPDFTRVDAALFYVFNKTFSAQLNVVNLLDEEHWTNAHNDNNISPGTTRGAFVTITASF